jgi:hypothetical protein
MRKPVLLIAGMLAISIVGAAAARSVPASSAPPILGGCEVLPADNIWNTPIDTLPVDASSAAYINAIGPTRQVHADFGSGLWEDAPIGIPYVVVPADQPLVPLNLGLYWDESDPGPYPVPTAAPIEGGPDSSLDSDRHVLVLRQSECKLYELYHAVPKANGWDADSSAVYTLTVNGPLRPAGWTSADAAGLPILPGLVRYDEVAAGEIKHALRFTVPQTRRAYVWPARHFASSLTGAQYPPMGQRFRLKAHYDISDFSPQAQVIARAMQKYGLILADNGGAWYISGAPDEQWDNEVLHELDVIVGADFEAVDVSSLMVDIDSGQVLNDFTLSTAPAARAIAPGGSTSVQLTTALRGYWGSPVTVTAGSPSPSVTVGLSGSSVPVPGSITLIVTDTHPGGSPPLWVTIPVTAAGSGVTHMARVGVLVAGWPVWLPIVRK